MCLPVIKPTYATAATTAAVSAQPDTCSKPLLTLRDIVTTQTANYTGMAHGTKYG